jgi:hypothetical protein
MFSKDTAETLASERKALAKLQDQHDALSADHAEKKKAAAEQLEVVSRLHGPASITLKTDDELAQSIKLLRKLQRESERSDGFLFDFTNGPGKDLESRWRDLRRREDDVKHSEARSALKEWLRRRYRALRAIADDEKADEGLAKAAGFPRGPVPICGSVGFERNRVNDFELELCAMGFEDLLPENAPMYILHQRLNKRPIPGQPVERKLAPTEKDMKVVEGRFPVPAMVSEIRERQTVSAAMASDVDKK